MSKPEGIYLSVDFRVSRGRELVDDATTKYLVVHYPPLLQGGAIAFFAFTGRAYLPDGTPTGAWLRETLRGVAEVPNDSIRHLFERLNRDAADGEPLIISVQSIRGEDRRLGVFTNAILKAGHVLGRPDFYFTGMKKLDAPTWFASGSGAVTLGRSASMTRLLNGQLPVGPRRVEDHMKLLATVNRRVALLDRTVSPACHVVYFSPEGKSKSAMFAERGEPTPVAMPILLGSVDLDVLFQDFMRWSQASAEGDTEAAPTDNDTMNKRLRRRP